MPLPAQTLSKKERLSGKTAVSELVSRGRWMKSEHFKYCLAENDMGFNRIVVSVPKKFFKRAVRRNLLKRRIREAYRTGKDCLNAGGTDIMFFYNSPEILDYETIRQELRKALSSVTK